MPGKEDYIKKFQDATSKILLDLINEKISKRNLPDKFLSDEDAVNYLLIKEGSDNLAFQSHTYILQKIIEQFISKYGKGNFSEYKNKLNTFSINVPSYDLGSIPTVEELQPETILDLMEDLHIDYLTSQYIYLRSSLKKKKSKYNLMSSGAVYTPKDIAENITRKAISIWFKHNPRKNPKILDLGAATGSFFFSALRVLAEYKKSTLVGSDIKEIILDNLYAVDYDPIAIDILKLRCLLEAGEFSPRYFDLLGNNIICKDMLHVNRNWVEDIDIAEILRAKLNSKTEGVSKFRSLKMKAYNQMGDERIVYEFEFPEIFNDKNKGFDVVLSNPPYFILKFARRNSKVAYLERFFEDQKKRIDSEMSYFRESGLYTYSIQGMLNYYRISLELAIRLLTGGGVLGVITPATIFGDVTASKLRKHMMIDNKICCIEFLPEHSKIFDGISQATVISHLIKGIKNGDIELIRNGRKERETVILDIDTIKKISGKSLKVPLVGKTDLDVLKKIDEFPKLGSLQFIKNKRGELDLTADRNFITHNKTENRLIRGDYIAKDGFFIDDSKANEFVTSEFFKKIDHNSRKYDSDKPRILGRQVANIDNGKRLISAIPRKFDIAANSCNYISIVDDSVDLYFILACLNSYLLNWRFKITSTNNHISNNELGDLPLPINDRILNQANKIDWKRMIDNIKNEDDILKINLYVMYLYGLNLQEIEHILAFKFDKTKIEEYWKGVSKNVDLPHLRSYSSQVL